MVAGATCRGLDPRWREREKERDVEEGGAAAWGCHQRLAAFVCRSWRRSAIIVDKGEKSTGLCVCVDMAAVCRVEIVLGLSLSEILKRGIEAIRVVGFCGEMLSSYTVL